MDSLGFEPRAPRMLSGSDTTSPRALADTQHWCKEQAWLGPCPTHMPLARLQAGTHFACTYDSLSFAKTTIEDHIHVLLKIVFVWLIALLCCFVDCTYTGSLFQWYSCSLDTCQTHLITVRMSAACGFMELAGLAQLDDQNTHSRPEQLPQPAIQSQLVDRKMRFASYSFGWPAIC